MMIHLRALSRIANRLSRHSVFIFALGAMLVPGVSPGRSSEESGDRATQYALSLDVHAVNGKYMYAEHCATCHGPIAYGDATRGIPALAGQRFSYIVRQLANFGAQERESTTMHRILAEQALRERQTWADIAGYLSRLPNNPAAQTGNGRRVALGLGIFHEQCASCHQLDAGEDDDGFVPSLRGQHYSYLVQERSLSRGSRHNMDENLVRFLISFDEHDIEAVADYPVPLAQPA